MRSVRNGNRTDLPAAWMLLAAIGMAATVSPVVGWAQQGFDRSKDRGPGVPLAIRHLRRARRAHRLSVFRVLR